MLAVPGAIALGRIFAQTAVPVRASDPAPYAVVAIALATMAGPAYRAASIEPSPALRSE